MNVNQFTESVSHLTRRIMALLLHVSGHDEGEKVGGGLPAGALHLGEARLILASTCCIKPLFHDQMLQAAARTGAESSSCATASTLRC